MGMPAALLVDEAAMAEADEALRALAEAYPAYAEAELDELSAALDHPRPADPDALFLPAHNLKGQGAAFGYDLITTLGEALCGLVRGRPMLTPDERTMAARLVDACRMVLTRRLTGDGGALGAQLLAGLRIGSA